MEEKTLKYRNEQELKGPFRSDKFLFLFCLIASCIVGIFFQKYLNSRKMSASFRHMFSFIGGMLIVLTCYGTKSFHLILVCSVTYGILKVFPLRHVFEVVFAFSFACMSWAHLYRMSFDYGNYSADISLPLMVLVQRLTLLAANLADGEVIKEEKQLHNARLHLRHPPHNHENGDGALRPGCSMSPLRREHAVTETPGLLEFFAYCVNFQTVLVGPPLAFKDYAIYIEGREEDRLRNCSEKAYFNEISKYFMQAVIFLVVYLGICHIFPSHFYLTDEFFNYTFDGKIVYLMTTGFTMRQHYYFAWSMGTLSCLLSGFGFSGFIGDYQPDYSLVTNFRFTKVEFPVSVKEMMDNWNIQTLRWLRITVFDRVPRSYGVYSVFFVSVLWHGFYPGYYLFFVSIGWYSTVGRSWRLKVRPWILARLPDTSSSKSGQTSQIYDAATRLVSYVFINYAALAFVLLSLHDSLVVWSRFYFVGHIGCAAVQISLAFWKPHSHSTLSG